MLNAVDLILRPTRNCVFSETLRLIVSLTRGRRKLTNRSVRRWFDDDCRSRETSAFDMERETGMRRGRKETMVDSGCLCGIVFVVRERFWGRRNARTAEGERALSRRSYVDSAVPRRPFEDGAREFRRRRTPWSDTRRPTAEALPGA